ncbi:uncharacterized protein [Arachis hypogaea]|uniref:uncharacterized protein n=1 Tax=Arachis hypogaea TaxID=3818 RepID=UPI003B21798E
MVMKEFRPISLCNVIYQILTKVLVNRFRPFLAEVIGPLQRGFIPGRGTNENIIIAQEILNFMHKTKSKKGTMTFKIDLEKAYDRILELFTKASELKVNLAKSKAQCSKNITQRRKEVLSRVSQIHLTQNIGRYLGVNIGHDRAAKKTVEEVIDKVQRRLASWKGRLLNKAGRLCFVKSMLTSIPVYNMQVAFFPSYACEKIDSMMKQFLWKGQTDGRGLPLVNWTKVVTPRKHGGLGVRDFRCANIALLGKLVWQLLHYKEKLWVQLLTKKYLAAGKGFVEVIGAFYVWKSVIKAFNSLKEGFVWCCGTLDQSLWFDQWSSLEIAIGPKLFEISSTLRSSRLKILKGNLSGSLHPMALSRSTVMRVFFSESSELVLGLMLAWETGCQRVICETDSLDTYLVLSNIIDHTTHEVKDIVLKLKTPRSFVQRLGGPVSSDSKGS